MAVFVLISDGGLLISRPGRTAAMYGSPLYANSYENCSVRYGHCHSHPISMMKAALSHKHRCSESDSTCTIHGNLKAQETEPPAPNQGTREHTQDTVLDLPYLSFTAPPIQAFYCESKQGNDSKDRLHIPASARDALVIGKGSGEGVKAAARPSWSGREGGRGGHHTWSAGVHVLEPDGDIEATHSRTCEVRVVGYALT